MKRMYLIYKTCMKANIASAITYRVNFILNSLIMLIGNVLFPLVTVFIYNSNASFAGWTFKEALLIQSVFILSTACAGIFLTELCGIRCPMWWRERWKWY